MSAFYHELPDHGGRIVVQATTSEEGWMTRSHSSVAILRDHCHLYLSAPTVDLITLLKAATQALEDSIVEYRCGRRGHASQTFDALGHYAEVDA